MRVGSNPTADIFDSPFCLLEIVITFAINFVFKRAHGVVVSRLLHMQKALGSNPSGSILLFKCQLLELSMISIVMSAASLV